MADVDSGPQHPGAGTAPQSASSPDGRAARLPGAITPPSGSRSDNDAGPGPGADADRALAAAEVSVMRDAGAGYNPRLATGSGGGGTRRRADPAADEAVMGVADAGGFEALDEGGEMVRVRFLDFLQTL